MLEEIKKDLVKNARAAEEMGLCRHRSGNFSVRDTASGLVCMTPSGADRQTMTPDDIVVMDEAGRVVEAVSGTRPTSEALMHLAAYEARPDVCAVVHTHSPFALVFAVLRQPIPAVVAEMAHLATKKGRIPLARYAPPGSKELAESVQEPLLESDALLLASHGVLTVDPGALSEALLKAAYVEKIAAVYYHARLLAKGDLPLLSPQDLGLRPPGKVGKER